MADECFTRSDSASEWRLTRNDVTIVGNADGDGPPVILLHGGPGLYDYFAGSLMTMWLEEEYSVWRYDQRGGGRSTVVCDLSIESHIADLDAVREQTNANRVTLLGHSWGGVLACHYAATFPERIERLILISTTGISRTWRQGFQETLLRRMDDDAKGRVQHLEQRIAASPQSAEAQRLHVERLNILVPFYLAEAHRGRAPKITSFNPRTYAIGFDTADRNAATPEFRESIARVSAPVHIIHGDSDCIPLNVVDDLVEAFPEARAHRLADCGHFPWIEQPIECQKAVAAALEPL